jgi:glucokinase
VTGSAVGVDVGGTKVLALAVDSGATVLAERRVETPADGEELLEAVAGVVVELWEAASGSAGGAVGVGMPGLVDPTGVLRFAPNLPGVVGLDVVGGLQRRLAAARPGGSGAVVVDNDATCAGAAEHLAGAARGVSDAILVTLGTGIGGAIVSGGSLLRGANHFAGEIGHMVIDPSGPACACGGRGCWEVFASGSALGRLAREAAEAGRAEDVLARAGSAAAVRGEHVVESALAGDEQAASIFELFGYWVALGLSNLANLLDPAVVVLGGGVVRAGDVLLEPIRRAFNATVEGAAHRPEVRIVAAERGADAGAIGAALLALSAG